MDKKERDEILGRKLPDSAVAKRIEEINTPENTIPERIPADVISLAKGLADIVCPHEIYGPYPAIWEKSELRMEYIEGATNGALAMYRHNQETISALQEQIKKLTEEKPKGLRWVKANERLPKDGQICVRRLGVDYSAAYVRTQHDGKRIICGMATQNSVWPNWKNTLEWLDEIESSDPSKEIEELKAEPSQVKAERDEYRKAIIEHIKTEPIESYSEQDDYADLKKALSLYLQSKTKHHE